MVFNELNQGRMGDFDFILFGGDMIHGGTYRALMQNFNNLISLQRKCRYQQLFVEKKGYDMQRRTRVNSWKFVPTSVVFAALVWGTA